LEGQLEKSEKNEKVRRAPIPRNLSSNFSNIYLPGPLSYLEHVPPGASLEPITRIGKLAPNLEFLIGIPTVKREKESYLMKTLESIIKEAKNRNFVI